MTILHVFLVVVMNPKKNMHSVFVIGLMRSVNVVSRKNRKNSLNKIMRTQKNVSILEHVQFLLDIACINAFAKFVYLRRDSHLSPTVLPQTLEEQFQFVFNKLFSYGI